MSDRASGYHYVVGKDGRKHRVYGPLKGQGAYYGGKGVSRAYAARSLAPLRGVGGYYDSKAVKFLKKWVPKNTFAGVGAGVGTGLGTALGNPVVGAGLGGALGKGLSTLLGFGAYKLSRNSLMVDEGTSPASMHSNSSCVKVRHREYITDIVSSSSANTFNLQSYAINPGLPTVFPWLSAIASQYQEYKPLGIVFEFKTLSATSIASSTNTTMGGIIMATDYNAINANFANKQAMDNAEYTVSAPVWQSFYHPIECDMKQNPLNTLYVRSGAVPGGSDQRMYDLGVFQIASFGVQGTSVVLGELWCTYEFELSKPISTSALGQDVLSDHLKIIAGTNAHPLGSGSIYQAGSSIQGLITLNSVYTFPSPIQEGTYLFAYSYTGNSTASTMATPTVANGSILQYFTGDTATVVSNTGQTVTTFMMTFIIQITGLNCAVTFSTAGTLPAVFSSGDLWVTQLDSNITA